MPKGDGAHTGLWSKVKERSSINSVHVRLVVRVGDV
jgi:hypothetical protein